MANRQQDYRSWDDRQRGGRERDYGQYMDTDEGDSSVRAGSYDEGRERQGGRYDPSQGEGRDRGSQTGRGFAGYGDFGQGDYDQPGRGANTGRSRYGQTGYGDSGFGYGQGNYGGPGYGRFAQPGRETATGRDWGSSARGDYSSEGRNWGSNWGPGRYGRDQSGYSGDRGIGAGEYEPYGERQAYGGMSQGQGQGMHRGKGPKNFQRSDERIKELLCERLHEDPFIDASEVTVNVQGGKITLEGTVEDRRTKNAIEDVAEQFGTMDVQNNLRVQRAGFGGSTETGSRSTSGATAQGGRSALGADEGETSKQKRN